MYLSRVSLDRKNHDVIKALSSPHVMHAMLASCLPSSSERSLWRVDPLGGGLALLLQSHTPPTRAPFSLDDWETRPYGTLLGKIQVGQVWRFRLCANPVHSVKTSEESRGKIFAHVTVDQQKQWLLKKCQTHGFSICRTGDGYLFDVVERDIKNFKRKEARVTLATAVFEGVLQIEEASLFCDKLKNGIGRGRAYGCGLLTLARM